MQHIVLVVPAESYRADAFLKAAARASQQLTILTDADTPLSSETLRVTSMYPPDDEVSHLEAVLFDLEPSVVLGVDEASTRLAARLSDRVGLTSARSSAVERAIDKAALRETLAKAELNQPTFVVTTLQELSMQTPEQIAALIDSPTEDFVIKPTRETASRGVIRTSPATLAQDLAILANIQDPTSPILLERYVDGEEFALEGIMSENQLEVLMIFDKPDIGEGPYFWETTYVGPARLTPQDQREIHSAVERGARALGLSNTPIHAELRLAQSRATILEIAPRSIGGRCGAVIRFGDGQRLEDVILARALGDTTAVRPLHHDIGITMLPTPARGVFQGVEGLEAARNVPGVTGIEITVTPGTLVYPPPLTDRYLGFIFAEGPGRQGVLQALSRARSLITIQIDADR
ncbi:MAG: ATP-grasp domain-containing protein [Ferrimicrobium sp.]